MLATESTLCYSLIINKRNKIMTVKTGKFIIISISNGSYSIAHQPYEHNTQEEAIQEAKRLATRYPSSEFTVLEVIGTAVVPSGAVFQ